MAEDKQCCCGSKMKERSDSEKKLLLNRLKRIEGQIRGIYGMVENDAYCIFLIRHLPLTRRLLHLIKHYFLIILRPA